ncbi:MAG: DUF4169 family protein [Rhodospirillaceae bacterium]|mgnify:FL=1|jgi:hypothetical protein|nr:DUF4169 family protein [Rhodospirillaceae bacterium]MDD9918904.1 DUF4169 family protein [Rhodospirillaceae bacterium]MDD9924345.1 DUF4169 family protein [Rhodospirillaceae bacterium]
MAEIINLREFRKSRERTSKSARAAENRAKSGRNKAEAARDRDAADRAEAEIDGKKIERGESDRPADPK